MEIIKDNILYNIYFNINNIPDISEGDSDENIFINKKIEKNKEEIKKNKIKKDKIKTDTIKEIKKTIVIKEIKDINIIIEINKI